MTVLQNSPDFSRATSLDIREMFRAILRVWPWMLGTVVLAVCVAIAYIHTQPDIYLRQLTFIAGNMASDKSYRSTGDSYIDAMLPDNSLSYNDLEIELRSPKIMREVVHTLGLEFDYQRHHTLFYGSQLPVILHSVDSEVSTSGMFTLHVDQTGAILLNDLQVGDNAVSTTYLTVPGDTIHTPFGRIVISGSKNLDYWKKKGYEIEVQISTTSAKAAQYAGRLDVSRVGKNTTAIRCQLTDRLPRRAEDILNHLMPVYCRQLRDLQVEALRNAGEWLQSRVNTIEGELSEIDNLKTGINQQHAVPNVASAAGSYFAESQNATTRRTALNTKISMIRYLRSLLGESMKNYELLPIISGIDDVSLTSQITEYNNLIRRRSNLVVSGGERHPQVIEADKAIDEARSILISTLDNINDVTLAQIDELRRVSSNASRKVADMVDSEASQLSIERQQKVKESMYLYFLQKLEENYVNQTAINPSIKILNAASGSSTPIAPKRIQILLLAIAIGIMIPVIIVFLRETTDTKIHGRRDLNNLQCAYVGEIPLLTGKRHKRWKQEERYELSEDLIVKDDGYDPVNEAFRIIRTNLEFMTVVADATHKVIMATSSYPDAGKTFVMLNMAVAMGLDRKRVLLIDFDMRKSSLSRYIGKPGRGVSEYLNESESSLDALIAKDALHPGVDMLPVGIEPPNPTELLSNQARLTTMFTALRTQYDYILVDCPPYNLVADSMLVNRHADLTLYILRADKDDLDQIPLINSIQSDGTLQRLTVLLNGIDERRYGHYSRYGRYGYHYGYRYGRK